MVWRPDGFEFSWDGAPFQKTVCSETLGAFAGWMGFGLYPVKGKETSHYVMDECSILDFKLSDDQVKELHDEYRAMMGESRKLEGAPEVTIEKMGRGKNGHIAIGTNSVPRAKWHLEQRGFKFIEESAVIKNGKLIAIYLEDEIGGFAFHLVQK